jgi:outer membrane protein assembly factor BamD
MRDRAILITLTIAMLGILLLACAGGGPPVVRSAREGFTEAQSLYEREKWDKARLAFEEIILNHPGSSLVDSAQFLFAMCYFNQNDPIVAAAEFLRLRTQYPTSPLVDDADYMRCLGLLSSAPSNSGLDQESTGEAVNELLLFKDSHPLSERVVSADSLLGIAYGRLSTKDHKTGVLYHKMGHYQASRIYFQGMIDQYPESPLVPDALYYMAEGQRKLDSLDSAIEYYEKLIYIYPDHDRTAKARKRVAKISQIQNEPQASE